MLKMHTLAKWMYGFLEPERPYGLPEDVYNETLDLALDRIAGAFAK